MLTPDPQIFDFRFIIGKEIGEIFVVFDDLESLSGSLLELDAGLIHDNAVRFISSYGWVQIKLDPFEDYDKVIPVVDEQFLLLYFFLQLFGDYLDVLRRS
jgi:hypothetical protein